MIQAAPARPGDVALVSATVDVDPATAFNAFTTQIEQWWRRGPRFRNARGDRGMLYLEPKLGGRLYESIGDGVVDSVVEIGRILLWAPPERLVFEWRNSNFAVDEATQVDVTFEASGAHTKITVRHSGLSSLREDHPARHGLNPTQYIRMIGLWWADLITALRSHLSREVGGDAGLNSIP